MNERLDELRDQFLERAGMGADMGSALRERLGELIDAHRAGVAEDIGRHVALQTETWSDKILGKRQSLIESQAAIDYADAGKVGMLAASAQDLAREMSRRRGVDSSVEEQALAKDYSGKVLRAAIEAGFERKDAKAAAGLFERFKDALPEPDRVRIERTPATVRLDERASAYMATLPPMDAELPMQDLLDGLLGHLDARSLSLSGVPKGEERRPERETWGDPGPDGDGRPSREEPFQAYTVRVELPHASIEVAGVAAPHPDHARHPDHLPDQ